MRASTSRSSAVAVLAAVLVAGGLLLAAGVVRAEVGTTPRHDARAVLHEIRLDLVDWAERVPWTYRVQAGDTLGQIVERELGTVRREQEVRDLNPGLRADAIRPGLRLLMPPKGCRTGDAGGWCAFFAFTPDPSGWSAPRRLDGGAIHRLGHGAQVYAVPCRRLPAVLAQDAEGLLDGDLLKADVGIPRSRPVAMLDALPRGDPAARITTHLRVGKIREGRVELVQVAERRYDAEGNILPPALATEEGGPSTPLLVLAFLAIFGGLVGALHVSRPPPLDALDETASEAEPLDDESGEEEAWDEGDDPGDPDDAEDGDDAEDDADPEQQADDDV